MAEQPSSFRSFRAYVAGRRDAAAAKRLLRTQAGAQLFPYADGIAQIARVEADDVSKRYRRAIAAPAERYRRFVTRYDAGDQPRRRADVVFNHRIYPWIMAALVVLEFPFNLMVMQVLGESLALTAVLAGGISILVPLLGHIIGKQLRLRHYFSALVIATSGLGLLLAGAFFRATYLREAAQVSDQRILYAFFAIGIVFLMVSTFASRYSEPDENWLNEEIQVAFERGQLLQDLRDIDVRRVVDANNAILDAYWRGLQRSWNGAPYPSEAGFHIEDLAQPPLWPPLAIEKSVPLPPSEHPNIAAVA